MTIYQKNMTAIKASSCPISNLLEGDPIQYETSRDNKVYPKGWYSSYRPTALGEKFLLITKAGTVIALGLGAGYQIEPLIASEKIKKIIVIESNLKIFSSILRTIDLTSIITHPKVKLFLGDNSDSAQSFTSQNYNPIIDGHIETFPLQASIELQRSFYVLYQKKLRAYLLNLSSDLSSQASFAKRWFSNIIRNIDQYSDQVTIKRAKDVIIIAAGSSVDHHIEEIKAYQSAGALIISCDASALLLKSYALEADYIITMDAQLFTNYHFIGIDNNTRLISDLSSNYFLAQRYNSTFFAGGHPLSQLTPLNRLPTQTGNIGSVAHAFARSLGATNIISFGLDFCYLKGQPYARGSYIYPIFHSASHRLLPAESSSVKLIFKHSHIKKKFYSDGQVDYQPDLFSFYKEQHTISLSYYIDPWTVKNFDGRHFLKNYSSAIRSLSPSDLSSPHNVTEGKKHILMTLMPLAARYYKNKVNEPLKDSYHFSLKFLKEMGY